MQSRIIKVLLCALAVLFGPGTLMATQAAANQIEDLEVVERGGEVHVRVMLSGPLEDAPESFTVAEPPRISFDFEQTGNALGRSQQQIDRGNLRSVNIIQAGDRTRLVLNLRAMSRYETQVDGRELLITLAGERARSVSASEQALATYAAASHAGQKSLQDVIFRRGEDSEARIFVQLSNPDVAVNVRERGRDLVVDFADAYTPEHLRRRSDVTDFATPVREMTLSQQGDDSQLVVTPRTNTHWEHNAYQTDTQFVLEVRPVEDVPDQLVPGARPGEYGGEALSLNFQDVDVRSVLQVIADFSDFNVVTSDSVRGSLTLRLQDVPWDQALDIILQAKGLDKRVTGNVIWIAPSEELAARQQMELQSRAQMSDLEPLQTESIQINYHRAEEIYEFLQNQERTMLSERGSVVFDQRTNKVFVTDARSRLESIRSLINDIDIAPRQVLIEARVVEASQGFNRDLGVRLGFRNLAGRAAVGGPLEETAFRSGQVVGPGVWDSGTPTNVPGGLNRPNQLGSRTVEGLGEVSPDSFSLVLWNSAATRFLNLELSALETDRRGRVISSPRVMTANQVEAVIEQGTEIPYRSETSAGATQVEFKKAVLSLGVRPQITPDGRILMAVNVHKDSPVDLGQAEPAIDTQNVRTEVLVENGGTVVIGGIYTEEESEAMSQVPLLGDIPVVGHLFRNRATSSSRTELLVFITPRIISDSLSLR